MAFTNFATGVDLTQAAGAFTPEDLGKLVDVAVQADSVAARTITQPGTGKDLVRYPKLVSFPEVAHYTELAEIALADPNTDEVLVPIYRTAGAHRTSRELAEDSTPDTAEMVASVLVNQIIRSVDAAYLGETTVNGPSGLLSTAYTTVETGASLSNLDAFIDAKFAAEANGGKLTSWIMRPAVANSILKLKKLGTGSNESLLSYNDAGDLVIAGLPVITSAQVDEATMFWGVSKARNVLVTRTGTSVERSTDSACARHHGELPLRHRFPARRGQRSRLRRSLMTE
ncbi:phage major capsid protein [Rhodococcus sp. NPDC060086]|uniref:phage major capsid protein n=1 Tax=Rhodococcus sp. NPDC060086 TaxID=3347055 RepID=UPI00366258DA